MKEPTEDQYKVACVLLSLDELRSKGLLSGGCKVDVPALKALVVSGRGLGYPKPTKDEVGEIYESIQKGQAGLN